MYLSKNIIRRYFLLVRALAFISCILFLCPFLVLIMTTYPKNSGEIGG